MKTTLKRLITKWWFWLIAVAVLILVICLVNNWYHTRISSWTPQASGWDCPAGRLIKGNAQSGIYHVPGGQYYSKTKPEKCFGSETEAIRAGYKKSER